MTWQEFQKKYADNNRNRRGAPLVRPDESLLAGMSLHEIEVEFRKQMRTNYANLKRMFIAMDKHLDGFISLEDLKSVLFQFTLPMSEQLFLALMDRLVTLPMLFSFPSNIFQYFVRPAIIGVDRNCWTSLFQHLKNFVIIVFL